MSKEYGGLSVVGWDAAAMPLGPENDVDKTRKRGGTKRTEGVSGIGSDRESADRIYIVRDGFVPETAI